MFPSTNGYHKMQTARPFGFFVVATAAAAAFNNKVLIGGR